MPTAFVTGGSGFVGGALIRRLVRDGWTVRGLARSDSSERAVADAGAEPVRGDVSDVDAMRTGATGAEVTFHAAAKVEDWGPPEEYEQVTVQGTRNALAASREAGRRLLHHRRRAGRLPRVRQRHAADAGRQAADTDAAGRRRRDGRGRRRDALEDVPPRRLAAAHPLRGLGQLAGVHDRHLAR